MPTEQINQSTAKVDIKSAWLSKINWTQFVSLVASILVVWGIDLDLATQAQIVVAIQAIQASATWVLKTWFTPTVTQSSVTMNK